MSRRTLAAPLALLLLGPACAADDKGEEEAPFTDAEKDDSFEVPIEHGALSFQAANPTEFGSLARFHSWTFELGGDAKLELATTSLDEDRDTVLYLYRREPGAASWGRNIAKDDDGGGGGLSRIMHQGDAAEYRIKVKGFTLDEVGAFAVAAACEGGGCPDATPREGTLACGELQVSSLDGELELEGDDGSTFRECWDEGSICWGGELEEARDALAGPLFDELWGGERFLERADVKGDDLVVVTVGEGGEHTMVVSECGE
jgi:hypothetical protein